MPTPVSATAPVATTARPTARASLFRSIFVTSLKHTALIPEGSKRLPSAPAKTAGTGKDSAHFAEVPREKFFRVSFLSDVATSTHERLGFTRLVVVATHSMRAGNSTRRIAGTGERDPADCARDAHNHARPAQFD